MVNKLRLFTQVFFLSDYKCKMISLECSPSKIWQLRSLKTLRGTSSEIVVVIKVSAYSFRKGRGKRPNRHPEQPNWEFAHMILRKETFINKRSPGDKKGLEQQHHR